jgi:TrmH RNA methyltransferase
MSHQPRFKTLDEKRRPTSQSREDKRPRQSKPMAVNYPSQGKKAGNAEGSVQISIKKRDPNAKKTGPLSPRAPEKIRNNKATEMKVYGENACLTLFRQRPEAIVRLWATVQMSHRIGEVLSYLAKQKKTYHIVSQEEMVKVAGTEHHGEICLLVKKPLPFSLEGYLQVPKQQDCLVLLDGVNNAQNIGGIIRTCAFYGVQGIVVEQRDLLNSAAAARVAEGGLEFVKSLETANKQIALEQLRQAGYQIVHLTRNKQAAMLAKTALSKKVVFVLSENVPEESEYPMDTNVQLAVSNPLNSGLNVAVNCGVVLAQWYQSQI